MVEVCDFKDWKESIWALETEETMTVIAKAPLVVYKDVYGMRLRSTCTGSHSLLVKHHL